MVHGFMVQRRPTLVMAGVVRLFMEQSWQPHMCRERKRDFASEMIDLSYGSEFAGPLCSRCRHPQERSCVVAHGFEHGVDK